MAQQIGIKATYMRGGTSKGTFFNFNDLPEEIKTNQKIKDNFLMRVVGSPDPYQKHIDGMGGATSSTSKVVLVEKSKKEDHDVDYYFGQVSIDKEFVDWSGNCGNLSSAVGPFAIYSGLINKEKIPKNGLATIKIWQANIQKTIIAYIPIVDGQVQESGDYFIDGVAFGSSEIILEFINPVDGKDDLFPTKNLIDTLEVPNIGSFKVTMLTAGIPTIFINASELGYSGIELQDDINNDTEALKKLEAIRIAGSIKMGLFHDKKQAYASQHIPKIAFISPPQNYTTSSGKSINKNTIDLNVRALSMGKLHHAMMGTASVAIGVAACIEGTLVNNAAGGGKKNTIEFGHPSGTLKVGASITKIKNKYIVKKASMSRSSRRIMQGEVFVPIDTLSK